MRSFFLSQLASDLVNLLLCSYQSCARVGSGYSDTELKNLHKLLGLFRHFSVIVSFFIARFIEKHWRVLGPNEKSPPYFELVNNTKNKLDVYLEPKQYSFCDL